MYSCFIGLISGTSEGSSSPATVSISRLSAVRCRPYDSASLSTDGPQMMPPVTSWPSTVSSRPSSGPSLVKPRKIQLGTEMMSPSWLTYSPCLPSTPQRTRNVPPKLMNTSAVKCRCRLLLTPFGIPAAPTL